MRKRTTLFTLIILATVLSNLLATTVLAQSNSVLDAAAAYFGEGMKLITAEAVYENLNDGDDSNDPFIIDIRKPEDYEASHVPGAVHLSGAEIFAPEGLDQLPLDRQVVVYCYTGQTAGQVVGALNMLGYDAYSLKFGMPSWAIAEGAPRWNDDTSMNYPLDAEPVEASETYELPDPLGVDVAEAAAAYFSEGMKLITAEAVYENLNDGDDSNDPFVLSICKPEDYEAGHIPGAVNIGAGGLFAPETIALLPNDRQVVVYCYTGQTAGQVVGALNMLGYDAYSLKFGIASWALREGSPRWNDDMSMGFPVEAAEAAAESAPTPVLPESGGWSIRLPLGVALMAIGLFVVIVFATRKKQLEV